MLSTKDLKHQMLRRRTEKLTERFVGPYNIKKIVLLNAVTLLENFLWKCSMGYILYSWIALLKPTLETSYKSQT